MVADQLCVVADLSTDRVGSWRERYRKYLLPHISNYEVPLRGLAIGKQMKFMKEEITALSREKISSGT